MGLRFALLAILTFSGDPEGFEELSPTERLELCARTLCEDWWRDDLANLDWLVTSPRIAQMTTDDLQTLIAAGEIHSFEGPRDLGFGIERTHFVRGRGGYVSSGLTVVSLGGKVAATSVRFQFTEGPVRPLWQKHWDRLGGPRLTQDSYGLHYVAENREQMAALEARLTSSLGPLPEIDIPKALKPHYSALTSIFDDLLVGTICGISGAPPSGMVALDRIVKRDRWDILAAVLHGANPEGRVYAAHAFRSRQRNGAPLSPEVLRALDVVEGLDVPIKHCAGCVVETGTLWDAHRILSFGEEGGLY
jgi:hypothetical protein